LTRFYALLLQFLGGLSQNLNPPFLCLWLVYVVCGLQPEMDELKREISRSQEATQLVGKGIQAKDIGGADSAPPSKKGDSRDAVAALLYRSINLLDDRGPSLILSPRAIANE
jgi:hypothetical protein